MVGAQLTTEQRVCLVETYIRTNSYYAVVGEFERRFPDRDIPNVSTIRRNVAKYRRYGTSLNLNKNRSGRRRTGRSNDNIETVRHAVEEAPRYVSARRNGTGIPSATFNRITRLDLRFHPYKIKIRHSLREPDFQRRRNFCGWLLHQFENPNFRSKIIIGDEASFCLNGTVSTQNVREYAPMGQPPDFHYDISELRAKVTVWAAVCGNGVILGPYFFDQNITGEVYLNMINEQIVPEMMEAFDFNIFGDVLFEEQWWFQDGAGAHRRRDVMERLVQLFGNKVVALNRDVEWPARSPDLTPCDFFLWGYIKSKVYMTPPPDILALRERILNEFRVLKMDPAMVIRAVGCMQTRANTCIERNGGHVEGHYA